jgi:hypothetical protein
MFQNCFTILELKESFTTYKWVIMYMSINICYNLVYNKIKECENLIFGDDLKF